MCAHKNYESRAAVIYLLLCAFVVLKMVPHLSKKTKKITSHCYFICSGPVMLEVVDLLVTDFLLISAKGLNKS